MKPSTATEESTEIRHFGFLEIGVLVLSVYVLGALVAQTVFHVPPNVSLLLDQIDTFVCVFFLADFGVRFRRAPSKLAFMKWGWIDLIASIPAYDFLRWGRILRLVRLVRILRAFRSDRHLLTFLYRNRAEGLIGTAVLAVIVLLIFSCIAVLVLEDSTDSNIKTPFDAVWWAVSTITTVGYGDKFPVTIEGKIVAIILMVTGVGFFGVLTGLFARLFVESEFQKEDSDIRQLTTEIRLLRERIDRMESERVETPDSPPR
ncbi:MAG: ion transporter [Chthoniobacteraceae bacterium]